MSEVVSQGVTSNGIVAYMASHPNAANLLMVLLVLVGLISLTGLERESWPTFKINVIEVMVEHPGASPDEIEESIILKIEEQVEGLDFVTEVKSSASPGVASVIVNLKEGTDMAQAIDDVEAAVSRIQTMPLEAKLPVVQERNSFQSVIRLIVYGDAPHKSLKSIAYFIEDELKSLPAVSLVDASGIKLDEISIEFSLEKLKALNLSLPEIAHVIRLNSLSLSSGSIEDGQSKIRIRTVDQHREQHEFEDIILLSRDDGTTVRLGDVAEIKDSLESSDLIVLHQGLPAVFVEIYRVAGEDISVIATSVKDHIDNVIKPSLPTGIEITIWNDETTIYSQRAYLLVKNGLIGLVLVALALILLLEIRFALWVVVGLLVTFVGVLSVMLVFDVSISTISLFVFVLALGMVVDDAVVVSESVHLERSRQSSPLEAAIQGAQRVRRPLVFAVLTSMVAFTPIFFIPGGVGNVWLPLPIIVIGILVLSLIESFYILPSHLAHVPLERNSEPNALTRLIERVQNWNRIKLHQFTEGPLHHAISFATEQPGVVISSCIGLLIVSISLLPAGLIATTFADVVEGDFVTASLEMPDGTSSERTLEVAQMIAEKGSEALTALEKETDFDATNLLVGMTITVGQPPRVEGGSILAAASSKPPSNIATVDMKLISAQFRSVATIEIADLWRRQVGVLPYVKGLTFSGEVIDFGPDVQTVISHPDPVQRRQIAEEAVNQLQGLEGVFDIRSDHTPGVRELKLELKPEGRVLDLSLEDMAIQVRSAFYGEEALRIQRGKEEVVVFVRLAQEDSESIYAIEDYEIRTPTGNYVPLKQVASISMGTAQTVNRRWNGERVINITASVDPAIRSSGETNAILADEILAKLKQDYPALEYESGGEQQRQQETLGVLYRGFVVAMLGIFVLLALATQSYSKPLVVMSIIPFGLIGVLLGHLILGIPFAAAAIMAILGLSGVLVNDTLVMVDYISEKHKSGMSIKESIVEGAKGRFRPIFITSLTTFLGFTPMILERAIQAQFLLPFAAALGVGLLISTAILMLLVPAFATLNMNWTERRSQRESSGKEEAQVTPELSSESSDPLRAS